MNNRNKEKKIIVILSVALALILIVGSLLIAFVWKYSEKDKGSDVITMEATDTTEAAEDAQNQNEANEAEASDGQGPQEDLDSEPAYDEWADVELIIDSEHYPKLYDLLYAISTNVVTTDYYGKKVIPGEFGEWEDVFALFEICDNNIGVGRTVAVEVEEIDEIPYELGCRKYCYDIECLEKFARTVTGKDLKLVSLQEAEDYLVGEYEDLRNYIEYEDDKMIVWEGAAGYMGPELEHVSASYLGNGTWEITGDICDFFTDFCWYGSLYATLKLDESSAFDGFALENIRWDAKKDMDNHSDWQVAYIEQLGDWYANDDEMYGAYNLAYNLIWFDDDDVPELVVEDPGYWISIWTYDGKEVRDIFYGAYGAAGVTAYYYIPHESIVDWVDINYAGLECCEEAIKMNSNYEFNSLYDEYPRSCFYIDANANGMYEEDEEIVDEEICYIGTREVSTEEYLSYVNDVIPGESEELTDNSFDTIDICEAIFRGME